MTKPKSRLNEMRRLRIEDRLSLQEIGNIFGITRQQVFNLIGSTRWVKQKPPKRKPTPYEKVAPRIRRSSPDQCWPFTGAKNSAGYGHVQYTPNQDYDKKNYYAHVVVYEHFYGPLDDGERVYHSCGNPACCNHGHLYAK